ncbi:histidinol-phosphatase [bacterium]|nr:histidinol-phosphatase [bacterium]
MYSTADSSVPCPGFADYHLHTALCGHAVGSMEAYVQQAVDSELTEIGFSDHLPLGPDRKQGHTMALFEMERYLQEISGLRQRYPQLRILVGGELGLYHGFEDDLQDLLDRFPLDYVIGSVHYFGESFVFGTPELSWTPRKRRREIGSCFELYRLGICSGLMTVIGHLDALTSLFPGEETAVIEGAERVLSEAAARGTILELNTSGLRKSGGVMFPAPPLLREAGRRNVPVWLGSDAHAPDQVGSAFGEAHALLGACGYTRRSLSKEGMHVFYPPF